MENKKLKIGICVPVHNLWSSYTKPCLDSIKTKHEYRIVLVDNASFDETSEEASKLVSDTFAHKRNEQNWGCAKSWNHGVKDSFEKGCDYVFIINNDVLFHPDAIDTLTDFMIDKQSHWLVKEREMEIAMVSCMDIRGECEKPEDIFTKNPEVKKEVPVSEHPNFSAFMINKVCWKKIGEFDEGFSLIGGAYFEDNSYHRRIQKSGMKALCIPTSLFYHYGSSTINVDMLAKLKGSQMFEKNKEYYSYKWGGTPGEEKYERPFNDSKKDVNWKIQDAHREECQCDVQCNSILKKYNLL